MTGTRNKLSAAMLTFIALTIMSMMSLGTLYPNGRSINAFGQGELVAASDSNPNGASYQDWTARYWQWLLSVPSDVNPVYYKDGSNCYKNQPEGNVWFLVGETEGIAVRTCSVPEGKAIFMPIIEVECDTATDDSLETEEEFSTCVDEALGNVSKVEATIDGNPITGLDDYKVRSGIVDVEVPELNLLAGSGTLKLMTDGYWIMINPLPKGEHVIELRAEVTQDAPPGEEPAPPAVTSVEYIAAIGTDVKPLPDIPTPPPPPVDNVPNTPDDNTPIPDDETPGQPTPQPPTQKPSGCLIATAAFGSELTPQVQYLRNFRENYILSTNAGSAFMNTFNTVYYSFSPQVADYEREQPWLQQTVKTAIYPLFGILGVSERAFWAADGGEFGSVMAGLTASVMIGTVYVSPLLAVAKPLQGKLRLDRKTVITLIAITAGSSAILAFAMFSGLFLEISSAGFVVALTGVSAMLASKFWWKIASIIKAARQSK